MSDDSFQTYRQLLKNLAVANPKDFERLVNLLKTFDEPRVKSAIDIIFDSILKMGESEVRILSKKRDHPYQRILLK